MPVITFTMPTLAIAAVYYLWRGYHTWYLQRQQLLRERVAAMLWVAVQEVD